MLTHVSMYSGRMAYAPINARGAGIEMRAQGNSDVEVSHRVYSSSFLDAKSALVHVFL